MTRMGRVRSTSGLLILAVSILLFIWGTWPAQRETRIRPVSRSTGLSLPEGRVIRLVFPPRIRAGDSGVVRLLLDADGPAAPSAEDGTGFYDVHAVIAEARFDIPGMSVRPSALISAPISQGQSAVFYWTLRSNDAGRYRGTIWLYLRTVDKSSGRESRETVSAQIVEIESVKLLGLPANQARAAGLAGAVAGLALSIPFFETLARNSLRKRAESHKIG